MAAHQNWGWEREPGPGALTEEHGVPDYDGALPAGTVTGVLLKAESDLLGLESGA